MQNFYNDRLSDYKREDQRWFCENHPHQRRRKGALKFKLGRNGNQKTGKMGR